MWVHTFRDQVNLLGGIWIGRGCSVQFLPLVALWSMEWFVINLCYLQRGEEGRKKKTADMLFAPIPELPTVRWAAFECPAAITSASGIKIKPLFFPTSVWTRDVWIGRKSVQGFYWTINVCLISRKTIIHLYSVSVLLTQNHKCRDVENIQPSNITYWQTTQTHTHSQKKFRVFFLPYQLSNCKCASQLKKKD